MTKKEEFIKKIAPAVEELADLCKKHEIPFLFLAQVDDKAEHTPCELSLSSDLYYKGVSLKLCEIQDDVTESFSKHDPIILAEDLKKMN